MKHYKICAVVEAANEDLIRRLLGMLEPQMTIIADSLQIKELDHPLLGQTVTILP